MGVTEQAEAPIQDRTILEHLFDVEWCTSPDADVAVAAEGREGALIGSGEGSVAGPALSGRIRFSFYSAECPYDPGFLAEAGLSWEEIGDHVCKINPAGLIEADDGARVQFEVKGFGLRLASRAPRWSLTAGVRLLSDDERHLWLNELVGLWEGEFNEETGIARYRVWARRPPGVSEEARG